MTRLPFRRSAGIDGPDAMTGTGTESATARVSSRAYPVRAPSWSMEVSRISPAPSAWQVAAHSTARV